MNLITKLVVVALAAVSNAVPLVRRGGGGGNGGAKLKYFGGPIIANVEITVLLWGSNVRDAATLGAFYNGIAQSSWFDVLNQYSTNGTVIGRGSYITTKDLTTIPGFPSKTSLDDNADIQPFLLSLIKAGTITPNKNSYYAIHFASGYSISINNAGSPAQSCQVFGAYHSTIYNTGANSATLPYYYYGVMPDCGGSTFVAASHELAETVTDPAAGVAAANTQANQPPAYPIAWNDPSASEVGDLCSGSGSTTGADGKSYTVQTIYSNKAGACVLA